MRGALIIVVLIAMLIVAMLVMKNVQTQKSTTPEEGMEAIERAQEAADKLEGVTRGQEKQIEGWGTP